MLHLTSLSTISCGTSLLQVSHEWPGLPAGVKFDPSDAELLEHLAAKCGVGNKKPHMLIEEFIPTLSGDEGICYTHPEKLPGEEHPNLVFLLDFPMCHILTIV